MERRAGEGNIEGKGETRTDNGKEMEGRERGERERGPGPCQYFHSEEISLPSPSLPLPSFSLPFPSPSLPSCPSISSLRSLPMIQLEGLGERCKLLQRVRGEPGRQINQLSKVCIN